MSQTQTGRRRTRWSGMGRTRGDDALGHAGRVKLELKADRMDEDKNEDKVDEGRQDRGTPWLDRASGQS